MNRTDVKFSLAGTQAMYAESHNICYCYHAESSRSSELVGRYSGLALADLSAVTVARFHSKYKKTSGCWLWEAGKYHHGYGMVFLRRDEDGKQVNGYAHRVAYVLAHGPIPFGMVVLHTCDTPACVNPAHLRLGTQGDNNRDTAHKRRCPKTRPWLHKISDAEVRMIRESSERNIYWAKRLGVTPSLISSIRRGSRRKAA